MTTVQITKQLQTLEKQVVTIHRKVQLLSAESMGRQYKQTVLQNTAGKLAGKLPRNSVAWQRKVRSEWDHRP